MGGSFYYLLYFTSHTAHQGLEAWQKLDYTEKIDCLKEGERVVDCGGSVARAWVALLGTWCMFRSLTRCGQVNRLLMVIGVLVPHQLQLRGNRCETKCECVRRVCSILSRVSIRSDLRDYRAWFDGSQFVLWVCLVLPGSVPFSGGVRVY